MRYIEAKDVGPDLSAIKWDSDLRTPATSNGRQFKRYRESLPNLILTDYVEFRRYADDAPGQTAQLAVGA